MLNSLKIKNFRALENFEVAKLGRVNLIVGKNNSGKSSVLEALRIYAGNAQRGLLESIAAEHDEVYQFPEVGRNDPSAALPFEAFFSGRRYPNEENDAIQIGELAAENSLLIEHGRYVIEYLRDSSNSVLDTRLKRVAKSELGDLNVEIGQALFLKKSGRHALIQLGINSAERMVSLPLPGLSPCAVIPTQLLTINELAKEWDKIALTDAQETVKEALKIITPNFFDIAFSGSDVRTARVKLIGVDKPVPLKSLGDGMLRVLQIALKIFSAKGGYLLIDEFENGLHYSVQENVWALIFELAKKLDIQVFATTHSWDCIESFAKVASARKDDGLLFRIGRSVRTSEKGRVIATTFDSEQLLSLTQADMEVR